jgi:ribonucleotide reductase beta subunit family protein with ferritin-like domain
MSSLDLTNYIFNPSIDKTNWWFFCLQEGCLWSSNEFKFAKDRDDYVKSSPRIQLLVRELHAFLLIGDGIIAEDIIKVLMPQALERKNIPLVYYLTVQLYIESQHAITYSKSFCSIVPREDVENIMSIIKESEPIMLKGEFMKKYNDTKSEGLANVSFAVGEGVFFVSLFAIIFFFREIDLFKDFIESNEQISKDETIHRDQKISEAKKTLKPEEYEEAKRIIIEGVELEKLNAKYLLRDYIFNAEADAEFGITVENVSGYVEMLADQIFVGLGFEAHYKTVVELKWMRDINLSQKTNFFERSVVGSYRNSDPTTSFDDSVNVLSKFFGQDSKEEESSENPISNYEDYDI